MAFGRRLQGACREPFTALVSLRASRGKWVFKLKMASKSPWKKKKSPRGRQGGKDYKFMDKILKALFAPLASFLSLFVGVLYLSSVSYILGANACMLSLPYE